MSHLKNSIIHDSQPVILVGGGAVGRDDFTLAKQWGRKIVAADGGAQAALKSGYLPDAVIGDFDSIDSDLLGKISQDRLYQIAEQDSTDFEKCLARITAPLIVGLGFMGLRPDHELAAYNALAKFPSVRCILVGAHMIAFLAPPAFEIEASADDRVSFFPMGPVCGQSTGLEYPIDTIDFSPNGRIGTSNRALGKIYAEFDGPDMLVLLDRDMLKPACEMLLNNPRHWPIA